MTAKQHPEIIIQARRGGTVESVHHAVAALAGPDGEIVERWGDPGMVTFWRSSAKPFQAQAWLTDGTVTQYLIPVSLATIEGVRISAIALAQLLDSNRPYVNAHHRGHRRYDPRTG